MQRHPRVTVVIPTYNRKSKVLRAIESVRSQTINDWQIVVIDNNSTDGTVSAIESLGESRLVILTIENRGVIAASRNKGAANSTSEYLAFLDSDDVWQPNKLAKCLAIAAKQKAEIVYHNVVLDGLHSKKTTNCRQLDSDVASDLIFNGNTLVTSSVLMTRSLFNRLNGFDESESIVGWEDYHLWVKAGLLEANFALAPGILGECQKHSDNFDNAERVLINLQQIRKYFESLNLVASEIWWIPYTKGRAHIELKLYRTAIESLRRVLYLSSPFRYKLISCILIVFCYFRIHFI